MSEDPATVNTEQPGTNVPSEVPNPEVTNVPVDPPAEASNAARVLAESKKWKSRALVAEKEGKDRKEQDLQQEGKAREAEKYWKGKYESQNATLTRERVQAEVAKVALTNGCHSVDALVKLGNMDLLTYDPETLQVDGVDAFVDHAKQHYGYLFGTTVAPNINPVAPGARAPVAPKQLSAMEIAKLPLQERNQYLLEARQKRLG